MSRSIALDFGRAAVAGEVPQTYTPLLPAAFAWQNFDGQINLDNTPAVVDPMSSHVRPLHTRKGLRFAEVSFKEALVRGSADGSAPPFFDLLAAAGFSIGTGATADVATLGNMPSNEKALTCELFDGLQKKWAYGVRGLVEILGEKAGDRIMVGFNGKGHGDIDDADTYPAGVVESNVKSAIFEGNSLTLGGYTPELRRCSFKTEQDPVQLTDAIADDGILEYYHTRTQAFLRVEVYLHTRTAKDWYNSLRDVVDNSHAINWGIPLGNGLKLSTTGTAMLVKTPNRTDSDGVGVMPLEFQFDRKSDVVISQIPE